MQPKAILINERGAYRHLNGQTLKIDLSGLCATFVPVYVHDPVYGEVRVDTSLNNVLFVDAAEIGQHLYDQCNWGTPGSEAKWKAFQVWASLHGFDVPSVKSYFNILYTSAV